MNELETNKGLAKLRPLDIAKVNKLAKENPLKPDVQLFNEADFAYVLSSHKDGQDYTWSPDIDRMHAIVDKAERYSGDEDETFSTDDDDENSYQTSESDSESNSEPSSGSDDIEPTSWPQEIYYNDFDTKLKNQLSSALITYLKQNLNQRQLVGLIAFSDKEYAVLPPNVLEQYDINNSYTNSITIINNKKALVNFHFLRKNLEDQNKVLYEGNLIIKVTDLNPENKNDIKNIDVELVDCAYTQNNMEAEAKRYEEEQEKQYKATEEARLKQEGIDHSIKVNALLDEFSTRPFIDSSSKITNSLAESTGTTAKDMDSKISETAKVATDNLNRTTQKSQLLLNSVDAFLMILSDLLKDAINTVRNTLPSFGA